MKERERESGGLAFLIEIRERIISRATCAGGAGGVCI